MRAQSQDQEDQLAQKVKRVRQKIIKKQLLIVSFLNLLTFVIFVFAMTYYQWFWMQFEFPKDNLDSRTHKYWVNLLYVRQDKLNSTYTSFLSTMAVCGKNIYCLTTLKQLQMMGVLCFAIFCVPILLQLYQFFLSLYSMVTIGQLHQSKSNFRYIMSIATYTVGLSLYWFAVAVMQYIDYKIGLSYWLCVAVLVLFFASIGYGGVSKRKMVKEGIIQNLLDKEKQARCQKLKADSHSNKSESGELHL